MALCSVAKQRRVRSVKAWLNNIICYLFISKNEHGKPLAFDIRTDRTCIGKGKKVFCYDTVEDVGWYPLTNPPAAVAVGVALSGVGVDGAYVPATPGRS